MSSTTKLFIPLLALILVGQGCFSLGGKTVTAGDGGVFKTGDAGDSWAQVNVIPGAKGIGTISGANIRTMEIDPQDKSVMYIGTLENGLLYTEDTAVTWQQPRTAALKSGPINDIEVDPNNVCTVYVAKQQRLYKTENCARSFDSETYVETRSSVFIRRIAVDWFNPDVVWIGLSNGDVFKSEDGGNTWQNKLSTRRAITEILINNSDSRSVLVSTDRKGFYKTTDSGENWEQLEEGIKALKNADMVHEMVQTSNSDTLIAATDYGLIRSNDFGNTWEALKLLTAPGQVDIKALAIAPDNANRVYYSASATFYASADGGSTWTTHSVPTTRAVEAMLIDPNDPSVLYIGVVAAQK